MILEIQMKLLLSFDKNCPSKSLKNLNPIKFYKTPIIIINEQMKWTLLLMTEELLIS